MSDLMSQDAQLVLWALTLAYVACLFFGAGCAVTFLARKEGLSQGNREGFHRGQALGYQRGIEDAKPLRAKNGWFVRRRK